MSPAFRPRAARMFRAGLTRCLALLPLLLAAAAGQGAEPQAPGRVPDSLLQQELKQQQIRATTQRVGQQLEAVISDFERNGIQGEDVKVL